MSGYEGFFFLIGWCVGALMLALAQRARKRYGGADRAFEEWVDSGNAPIALTNMSEQRPIFRGIARAAFVAGLHRTP